MSTSAEAQALDLVDLASYPIDDPESAELAALVDRCRGQLAATGTSMLFVTKADIRGDEHAMLV